MKYITPHYIIVAFIIMINFSTILLAQPPLPSGFYGSLSVKGEPAPVGATVSAWINGVHYPTDFTVSAIGVYGLLFVNGDDLNTVNKKEGGVPGDKITFRVTIGENIYVASQTGAWDGNGINRKLDLTANDIIPVELSSFIYSVNNNSVELVWSTTTETNNLGFEIQRSQDEKNFSKIGFVPGHGTSTTIHRYTYSDQELSPGTYFYRLKQIDFDGTFTYSQTLSVNITTPLTFKLYQNYPNPFNLETNIQYALPQDNYVTINIYDMRGQLVTKLVNESNSAGSYLVTWDSKDNNGEKVTSGTYLYRITAGKFTMTRKMILMK